MYMYTFLLVVPRQDKKMVAQDMVRTREVDSVIRSVLDISKKTEADSYLKFDKLII